MIEHLEKFERMWFLDEQTDDEITWDLMEQFEKAHPHFSEHLKEAAQMVRLACLYSSMANMTSPPQKYEFVREVDGWLIGIGNDLSSGPEYPMTFELENE